MKLVRASRGEYLFQMSGRERSLFREVLRHFPLVPLAHHTLSRTQPAEAKAENDRLLRQAMSARQEEQKGRLEKLLADPGRVAAQGRAWRIAFAPEEMEWLLQVLNDVRIGSWLILGCPDPDEGRGPQVTQASARYLFLMELSDHFQCALLEALDRPADAT